MLRVDEDGRTLIEYHLFHYVTHSMVVNIYWASDDGPNMEYDRDGAPYGRLTFLFNERDHAIRFVSGDRAERFFTYEVTTHEDWMPPDYGECADSECGCKA